MRHLVPFVGEQKVVRADDEQARVKRTEGRVIDDVIGNGKVESSWDDVVPDGWADKSKPKPLTPPTAAAHASIAMPRAHVPIKPGVKSAAPTKKTAPAKPSSSSAVTFSDAASMDWVRINNGRGLRVSIYGNIDNDLRKEWSRLLNDPESADIKEFEFNLSETPALSLTGLGMLLLFKERKGSVRDAIKLCNCNKEVTQLLQWTGMDKYFAIESAHILPPK
ncbi:STAS domain-containing protein [Cellvibrio sp. OA-2007]|uniref:STAS domain-containing protein n=1 Tax=Cellvibrio sp. OA-2007 TaxID=529823 RepID=UPI000783B599|nr:STAS domain-containing protein [Cellvibrio sp. OA-2007]